MLMVVASGVTSILDVILIVLMLLGYATSKVAVTLLSNDISDNTFLSLEVESKLF